MARGRRGGASVARATREWLKSVLIALGLFLVIRTVLVEAFKIPTSSMEGTLLVGDFLLVNKAVYGAEIPGLGLRLPAFQEPARGQVVVFDPPHDATKNYVKRVVGLPGDTLMMRGKALHLNGRRLAEPYARHLDPEGDAVHPNMAWQVDHARGMGLLAPERPSRDNWGPVVVPPASFFVLGDNRDNSEDSRYWGFVSRSAIRGRPWRIYYSFDHEADSTTPWISDVRWSRIGGSIQ